MNGFFYFIIFHGNPAPDIERNGRLSVSLQEDNGCGNMATAMYILIKLLKKIEALAPHMNHIRALSGRVSNMLKNAVFMKGFASCLSS